MGIQVGPVRHHWNYFLALEDDIVRMARYLEPAEENFSAYSLELARIIITAASEVDVVAKLLCQKIDSGSKARTIDAYRKTIVPAYDKLPGALVTLPKFGLTLNPWEQWGQVEKNPVWWKAYNDVKHHRNDHFPSASLKHALNAVAGLFLLLLFLYREEGRSGELNPDPAIFFPGSPFVVDYAFYGKRQALYFLDGDQLPING